MFIAKALTSPALLSSAHNNSAADVHQQTTPHCCFGSRFLLCQLQSRSSAHNSAAHVHQQTTPHSFFGSWFLLCQLQSRSRSYSALTFCSGSAPSAANPLSCSKVPSKFLGHESSSFQPCFNSSRVLLNFVVSTATKSSRFSCFQSRLTVTATKASATSCHALPYTVRLTVLFVAVLSCWFTFSLRRFIRKCKQGCLQFVILKPILVAVTLILYSKGKYEDGNFSPRQAYLYLTIIYKISYTMALYALVLFYMACKDLLQPFNPVPKFIIIKSVVFLTYWQGVLVFLAAKSGFLKDAEEASQFQNFIICVEMLIAAVDHLYAFPYKEYAGANIGGSRGLTGSLAHALKLNDFYHDTFTICTNIS